MGFFGVPGGSGQGDGLAYIRPPRTPVRVYDAGWSSPVARQAHNLKVTGSNPVPATIEEKARLRRAFFRCLHGSGFQKVRGPAKDRGPPGGGAARLSTTSAFLALYVLPMTSTYPLAPVSWGELLDKITILQIKAERLTDAAKRANVVTELTIAVADRRCGLGGGRASGGRTQDHQ